MDENKLYDSDFYSWINFNIKLIEDDDKSKIDYTNLLKELRWMSQKQRKYIINTLTLLVGHMLKWDFQPAYRHRGWYEMIKEQRKAIKNILFVSPSQREEIKDIIKEEYENAVHVAMEETRMDRDSFPKDLLYSEEDIFDKVYEMPTE